MERLTERDEYDNADIIDVDSSDLQSNLSYKEFNLVTEALNRLAEFEDEREEWVKTYEACKRVIEEYGLEAQMYMVIEELSELIKSVCKHRRADNYKNIIEEIADVEIMLQQLKIMLQILPSEIQKIKEQKLQRTIDKIKEAAKRSELND